MARRNPIERLPQAVAEAVVTRIVQMIDINEIVERVDLNELVDRVDVNRLVERVDVDALVQRVDLDALMAHVDVDAIANRIDIDRIMQNTEFSSLISKSTTGALNEFLALLRRQVVSLDVLFDKLTHRKRFASRPLGPPELANEWDDDDDGRQGEYAGAISRLLAIAFDVFAAWALFLLGLGAIQATINIFLTHPPTVFHHGLVSIFVATVWYFIYFSAQWSLGGRTLGMALLGVRVLSAEGTPIDQRQSAIRTVVLPFSIVIFLLGLIGIVLRADRRGWHDQAASTCVVYDWDARAAKMHWLQHADS